jgi:hypothetical protein
MLGCQDFCGYYDWTFDFVHRRFGQAAIELLWREAIGADSQQHYANSAARSGLRGLYEAWVGTGEDEHCDWTFTLDEQKNALRWDMRECPSKGFLIEHDLNADADYCNHCMGWIIPVLENVGVEVVEHEHNHCGQCWAIMRRKDRPMQPLDVELDIRRDTRWNRGYLDRWEHDRVMPYLPSVSQSGDPCDVLKSWFCEAEDFVLLADVPGQENSLAAIRSFAFKRSFPATLATDEAYNDPLACPMQPRAVLIGCPPADLKATAARYHRTPLADRPLLMHAYLPAVPFVDFLSAGLPRPVPILPLLICENEYEHRPGGRHPTTAEFLVLLAATLKKQVVA